MAATRLLLWILLIGCALGGVLATVTGEVSSGGEVEVQNLMSEFNFTREQVLELIKGFKAFDEDEDGKVTVAELGVVMRKRGNNLTETQLQEIVKQWDTDGNGTLELHECVHMMSGNKKKMQALQEEALKNKALEAFTDFDKDGNGLISSWELRQGMTDLGKGLCEQSFDNMFRQADLNRDGFLDKNEFVEYFFKGERHSQVTHQNH